MKSLILEKEIEYLTNEWNNTTINYRTKEDVII